MLHIDKSGDSYVRYLVIAYVHYDKQIKAQSETHGGWLTCVN